MLLGAKVRGNESSCYPPLGSFAPWLMRPLTLDDSPPLLNIPVIRY